MRVPEIFFPRNPRSRYLYLLLWLVGYLLTSAIAEEAGGKMWLMDLLFVGVLAATLRAVSRTPGEFLAAAILGGLSMASSLAAIIHPEPGFLIARAILSSLFTGSLSVVILREVLQGGSIDIDKIFGAVCAYLLVGVCWAGIYSFVEQIRPGSLSLPAVAAGRSAASRSEIFLYFSFVTLSTLGYGDITPLVASTRTLAWMEAVFGQFYIAVLVARLVGLIEFGAVEAGADRAGREEP